MSFNGNNTHYIDKFNKKIEFDEKQNPKKYHKNPDRNVNNGLIKEWNDTKNYFDQFKKEIPQSTKYNIDNIDNIICEIKQNEDSVTIREIVNEDSFNLAIKYINEGYNPLVLNMASDWRPGGGVSNGKTAQEEELFRRSNAHQTHPQHWYPLKENEVIYSPQVVVIKDSRDKKYEYIDEIAMSMIACAAVRKPKLVNGEYNKNDYEIMYKKIESIFKIGILHNHDSLVLGALGCGAFYNPPEEVAKIVSILLDKYGKYFKKIGFAILVAKSKDNNNIDTFKKILNL